MAPVWRWPEQPLSSLLPTLRFVSQEISKFEKSADPCALYGSLPSEPLASLLVSCLPQHSIHSQAAIFWVTRRLERNRQNARKQERQVPAAAVLKDLCPRCSHPLRSVLFERNAFDWDTLCMWGWGELHSSCCRQFWRSGCRGFATRLDFSSQFLCEMLATSSLMNSSRCISASSYACRMPAALELLC